jgi:hypothetical protein
MNLRMNMNGRRRCRGAIIAALVSALGGVAVAQDTPPSEQPPSDAAKPEPSTVMSGAWEFSNADRDKVCRFVFRPDAVGGGYKLDIDRNCATLFPVTKDIVAWTTDKFGALRLIDTHGGAVIELTEAETGIYDGFEPGQGRYILQIAAAAPVRSADDMVGDWAFARGTGKPICALTLANAPAGADTLALKVKPGCDPLITRFGPSSWRMNQGELQLLSLRGQTWRFEENDADTWQRVPESSDPILLVRQ